MPENTMTLKSLKQRLSFTSAIALAVLTPLLLAALVPLIAAFRLG